MEVTLTKLTEPVFELSGGALALDFANSIEKRPLPEPLDHLNSYADLVAWAVQSGIVERSKGERLRAAARLHTSEGERVLQRAIRLREAIFRIFSAIAAGQQVNASELDLVRQEALVAYKHARLAAQSGAFHWEFADDPHALDCVLWPVAQNAIDLLADRESLVCVRECASDRCAWLFLDRSHNRSRRWCDMKVCGNRAKSRRHYRRARQASAG